MATQASLIAVQKAYIAYYGRPADSGGLQYWAERADAEGLDTIIDAFGNTAESQALFAGMDYSQIVTQLYNQLFNRDPEDSGLDYWVGELEAGNISEAGIALHLVMAAGGEDVDTLNAKVAVADAFSEALDTEAELAAYNGDAAAQVARDMLQTVGADTDVKSFNGVEAAINKMVNPGSVFTLTEIRTELPDTVPTQMATYWGNPETGEGVPAGQLWNTINAYLSDDIKADLFDINDSLSEINQITLTGLGDMMQGGAPGDQFNGDAATGGDDADTGYDTGKEGDYTGNYQIRVELSDGTINEAIVTLTQEQFEFLNGLMFDDEGNSRLYEQEVAYQVPARDPNGNTMTDAGGATILVDAVVDGGYLVQPIVLTPSSNNGGSEEAGFTSAGDDFIVAARLELLHGAYIDGGAGVNTLEIDAKGHFAQPKELLNIQHVKVENLPNVYTYVADGDSNITDNVNDYPDVQETNIGDVDSIIDLSRAIDIETLTVTEGNFEGLDGQQFAGALTLTGIRNGVTTTLDGGFTQDVTLNYGDMSDAEGVNLVFHNLSMGDGDTEGGSWNAQLVVAHNAETLNIESTGAGNFLDNGDLGGELSTLNITGDAHLYIEDDLDNSFHDENPVTIDASGNTGGVNLNLSNSQNVTFLGSTGNDIFNVSTTEAGVAYVDDGNDQTVTIVATEGDNHYEVVTGTAVITDGDGNNSMEVDAAVAEITVGEGDNNLYVEADESVSIVALNGDNTVEVMPGSSSDDVLSVSVELGDGDNTVSVSGSEIAVTTGAGNDSLTLVGTESTYVDEGALITINTGTGEDSLVLGQDDSESSQSGIVAKVGSSITGENIAMYVENAADLRAAELSGITSVVLNYDIIDVTPATPALTLTADQFAAIGAENFSVEGTPFYEAGVLKLIVTESTSLAALGVDDLPSNLNLQLELQDGVVLEMTAEQLHTKVASGGVTLAADSNHDLEPGSVYITNAGNDFDAYSDGTNGLGGTLANGVGSRIENGGTYERPDQEGEVLSRWVHDSDDSATITADDSNANLLRLVGDSDLTMVTVEGGIDDWGRVTDEALAIELNVDGDNDDGFFVDFSGLNGQLIDMTLARFEDVVAVYGNGLDARLNVHLTGNLGTAEQGLVSRDVQTYVVTSIVTDADADADPATVAGEVNFYTCETTQDLETLGLQGNYTKTVNFLNTELNVDFLMEVAYSKASGYSVGTLVGEYARAGADAVVNVVGLDALPEGEVQKVKGIELINADTAEINVTGGDTVIESLVGTAVETFTFTADADLTVETSFIADDVTEVVDGTAVAGDFNLTVAGEIDLSEIELLGVDKLLLEDGADVTLSAQQLVDLADKIVQDEGATTNLNVVELSTEALDLGAIDVDTIGTVTFADVDGTIVAAVANFGDAESVNIVAEENDTAVEMTAEQFATITDGTVNVSEDNDNDATLVLTDLANDEVLNLDNVDGDADVVLRVEDLVATSDMEIQEDGEVVSITLEVVGDVDLTEADLTGVTIDSVNIADGATLTLTASQAAAIGIADTDPEDGIADNWTGTGTLNIVDLSTESLDLNLIEEAGINIGTVTIQDANTGLTIDEDTTFGGADEIVTPTAEDGAPEWGTERTTVTMTVDQFLSSAGIITGDSKINLTDLYNNVDTDTYGELDYIPDAVELDLSGIANAGTITFAEDTVNYADGDPQTVQHVITLTDTANLGGFTIALADGELIRFATEAQAAATITAESGDITGVQWLWTEFGAEVDTSGYDGDITTLFIDEALLVSQNTEEDLWSTLEGSIVVEKINGTVIPELVKYDRVNTFEAFTNIGDGINYDDDAAFGTIAKLTMNLEGEVNLGAILLGDTNNGDGNTPNIDGEGYFETLTINSYLDLSNNEGYDASNPNTLPGRVIETNTLGDISLNAGSLDQLVDITINTYGDVDDGEGFTDDANVNGATTQRDGLAIETGTITFASNDGETVTSDLGNGANAVLTITGANDVTIEAIDISDAEVSRLDVDLDDYYGAYASNGELTIGGININDLDEEMGLSEGTAADVLDGIVYIDDYTAETGDTIGFDPDGPEANADILMVVTDGTNDLTEIAIGDFDVTGVYVSGDATITLTEEQVQAIGEGNFSVAAGVNVTLNVTDIPNGSDIDLNVIQDAGFNIGTLSTADEDVTLDDAATLGGADAVVVMLDDDDRTFTLTAEQHSQISGDITEDDQDATTANKASVVVTDLGDLATETYNTVIGSKDARDYDVTNIDLSNVLTTGSNKVEVNDAGVDVTDTNADGVSIGDVMLHPDANLGNFAVVLQSEGSALNDLLGQNIRFFDEVQASREIIVEGASATDNGTNVIWLFDTLPAGTKVDTAMYDSELGRVWILSDLADGANVEDLYTDLSESIIVRIVNGEDLSDLLPGTTPFTRVVEVEAFTELPGGLTFNDIDDTDGQPYDFIENLTITLGGAVDMGDLAVDNVISEPLANDDEFGTLTINSFLANGDTHYLLPEDFDTDENPRPDELGTASDQWNYIGDIRGDGAYVGTGTARIELETVVVNTSAAGETGTALDIQTIFFSEEAGETSVASFTANGNNNVTIKSLDTTDPEITGLNTVNNLVGATLLVTGGSPAFDGGATGNTETLSVTTTNAGATTTFGSADDSDGVGVYAGVYGPELSFIDVDGAGTTNLGTLADIDGTIDATDSPNGFEFTATGTGTVTATLGEANVDGTDIAPAIEAGEAWTFTFDTNAGTDGALTVESAVEFNGGEVEFSMGNADLVIDGDVDMQALADLDYSVGTGNVVLVEDATLQLTDEQWLTSGLATANFVDENGDPTVLVVDAAFVAEFGSDLTHVFGYAEYDIESGVAVTLREDQADVAYVDGDDVNPGVLTGADVTVFVQETGFGDNDITDLTGVDALVIEADATDNTDGDLATLPNTFGYDVTMTVEQADSLVGNITKNGNTVIAEAGDSGDANPVDLTDPAGDGSVPAYDLTEVDTLYVEDNDGTIINLTQFNAIGGGANITTDGTAPVTLIGSGDLTNEDLTGITSIILDGDMTLTLAQVDAITAAGGTIEEDATGGYTLTVTDAEATGADTTPADGFIDAGSTINIDMSVVTVTNSSVALDTNTTDPGDGVTVIDGNYTVTGDLNGATLALSGTGTVTMDVTVANGETITGTTATVNLTDAASAGDDLNGDVINLANIATAVSGTFTMSEDAVLDAATDLGDFTIDTTATPYDLTGTAAQLSEVDVIGDGDVTVTALGSALVDLSTIVAAGTLTAQVLNDSTTTDVTLNTATDLGDFDVDVVGTVTDLSVTAEQIDGLAVTDSGATLTDLTVTAFEDALGAVLTGVVSADYDTDVQLDSTGNVVIAAGADLSGLHTGSQVTISGNGTVTIADESGVGADDGADVDTTDFVVGLGATLVSDFEQADADSIVDIANVTGAGKLQIISDDGSTMTLTQNVRYSEVVLNGTDAGVVIDGFHDTSDFFVYDPAGADLIGRHSLNLNETLATAGTDYEEGAGAITIGADTGLFVYTGDIASADAAGIEDLFDGTTANLQFAANGDTIYLMADDGVDTYIWLVDDANDDSEFDAVNDTAELIVTLTGVADASQLSEANFVDFLV